MEVMEKVMFNATPANEQSISYSHVYGEYNTYCASGIIVIFRMAIKWWLDCTHSSQRPGQYQFPQR